MKKPKCVLVSPAPGSVSQFEPFYTWEIVKELEDRVRELEELLSEIEKADVLLVATYYADKARALLGEKEVWGLKKSYRRG